MIRHAALSKLILVSLWGFIALYLNALTPHESHALCATVKIEIRQELTLERQAFDAHMRINNGLSTIPIEDVRVVVNFADEYGNPVLASSDSNDTSASFYIRVDIAAMENIENVDGSGTVAPNTSADIHWLIIPAPDSSNGLESGTLYYVGATLSYTAAGQSETIEVSPDYIFVKPMPQLVLDYFLPTDVYGDDAWTETIEAPVPFDLGLRVGNKGYGYARSLKVESAQPKIVENDQGLLVGFQIEGTRVNGLPASSSLLADFGDIAPNSAGTARWIMSCTLSGQFTGFSAEFSHADELGGKLTSLIDESDVRTHFLVQSVLVDAEGRDAIEDFLAIDGDVYRVYESDNVDQDVTDASSAASLSYVSSGVYKLTTPSVSGFMYTRVSDPTSGAMVIKEALRSDGKRIKAANVWVSKTREGSGPWQYFLNIFDFNTAGTYTIGLQDPAVLPQAPVIAYIPERTRVEGQQVSFLVEASDPNGTIPLLSAERLPLGASFVDQGNGTGLFDWTPQVGQAGRYIIKFIATDGALESSRQAVICVFSQDDTDGDGMLDSWEMEHFGSLDNDGTGDADGDGITDLDEYLNGFDPNDSQSAPSIPEVFSPRDAAHVDLLTPELEIVNSIDPEADTIAYTFEIYADDEYKELIASQSGTPQQSDITAWSVPETLDDNTDYYWRARAADATGSSDWVYSHFFTDLENDPPAAPRISFPADGTNVDTTTPVLEIINSRDVDDNVITYDFEVFADSDMTTMVVSATDIASGENHRTGWVVDPALADESTYYWRAVARDSLGAQTSSALVSFQVDTINHAPAAPLVTMPLNEAEVTSLYTALSVTDAADPDGDAVLCYFEMDTTPTFDGTGKIVSGPISPTDGEIAWLVGELTDNTLYFWRVKCSDGAADSPWTEARFFVNAYNEAPPAPELKNPGLNAWMNTLSPILSVHPVDDVDHDILKYRFELYTDPDLTRSVGYAERDDASWQGLSPLSSGTWYYWRAQAVDQHGISGPWSETGTFFVKSNGVNMAPRLIFTAPDAPLAANGQEIDIQWSDYDPDSNALISLYFDTDDSGQDGTLITDAIEEDPDGNADYYTWDISSLEGTYYLYAVIDDGFTSETVYCPVAVSVDHTAPVIVVSPTGGTYTEALQVTLTADEAADIYYTLDGSDPTTGSEMYDAPLTIDQDSTLRAIAVDTAGNQSATASETFTFAVDITVTVGTDQGRLLDAIPVYAFTDSGSYTGKTAVTDADGEAHFDPVLFSAGNYKFRIDYLGRQFWSPSAPLPDTRSIAVVIAETSVTVTANTAAGPAAGVRVYLFSEAGTYLGQYLTTNADGQVVFDLPVGFAFKFRADLYGNQYWGDIAAVTAGDINTVSVDAGGGLLQARVIKSEESPLDGVRVYLFNTSGSYLGFSGITDAQGQAAFNVPAGTYKLRADYLGYQFWSDDTPVVTDTLATVTVPHQQIQVAVNSRYQETAEPIDAVSVYLYSAAGSYLGITKNSDAQGLVTFNLPEKAYKIRADYLGQQYWSDEFIWQDPAITIPMSDARVTVTGAGYALPNVRVYLFNSVNSYLGRYADTDADGKCLFRLPEGTYRFRADYQGSQFWSADAVLTADQLLDIGVPTGGGSFTFTVLQAEDDPLVGVECYLFDGADNYLGLHGTTDSNGQVPFDLSDGTYRLRADYLGYQFWSDPVQVPDLLSAGLTIAHTPVDVTVLTAAGPASGTKVYLFKEDGVYQGRYLVTDDLGQVQFNLPAEVSYAFRADLLGGQYWSDPILVPATSPAPVEINAGGGQLQLLVQDGEGLPMAGLDVFLYSANDAYLGIRKVSDTAGAAAFDLPQGTYRLRVDYLGYSFWTDAIQVQQDSQVVMPIAHQPVNITVQGSYQGVTAPFEAVRTYLYTPTGSYLGRYQDTDTDGQTVFSLPEHNYKVRADLVGEQFWSDTFTGTDGDIAITVPMADLRGVVTGAGLPQAGLTVYLYSQSGAYLGRQADTDAAGSVTFRIPAGTYLIRADYQGNQYWSAPLAANADQINETIVSVGGGSVALSVRQDSATPMPGVQCYVFNGSGSYIGYSGATDEQGIVSFDLADGIVRFRADYMGYSYWSQDITLPESLSADIEIPHQSVVFTLTGDYLGVAESLTGQPVYLFTPAGSYLGISQLTDENGQAFFALPDQIYKIRADYLGRQYWSEPFQSQDAAVQIAQGAVDIHVTRDLADVSGARIYLFSTTGNYLGRYTTTDSAGLAAYILPEGTYRFRVDLDGIQQWSDDVEIPADQSSQLEIELP